MIRDMEAYVKSLWDWSFINSLLPRHMSIGDVDGICVLPSGHFLILEGKHAQRDRPPHSIPKGQLLGFRYLARTGKATILMLGGRPPNEVYWMRVMSGETEDTKWLPATNETVQRFILHWLQKHDSYFDVDLENETTTSTALGD